MAPRLMNAERERKEIGLITARAELTLGVLGNVGQIMRGLMLGTVLVRGRLVGGVRLIRMGHVRAKALEAIRGQGGRERERGRRSLL